MIVYAIFAFDGRTPFPSLYALAPTVGTVLIVLFARPGTFAHAVLSLKPLVGVGLISYSLYLWHQPIFAFYRHYNDFILPPAAALYLIVVAFVLAFISYRFVERPFRDKVKFSGRSVFAISGIVGAILLVSGGAVQLRFQDYKNFWLAHQSSEVRSLVAILEEADPQLSNFGMKEDMSQILSDCRFNVTKLDAGTQKRILHCAEIYGPGVLILGDSHAIDLFGVVASKFDAPFIVGITQGFCRPHTPKKSCQYESVLKFVSGSDPGFGHVIFEQAGFYLMLAADGKKGSRAMFNKHGLAEDVGALAVDEDHARKTLSYLRQLAEHVPVTWVGPRIEPHISRRAVIKRGCSFGFALRPGLAAAFGRLDTHLRTIVSAAPNVRYRSQNDIMDFRWPDDFMNCDTTFWSDGDHYSESGEVRFGQRLPDDFLVFREQ